MSLQGFDIVLAIRLLRPATTLAELATELGVVPSQVHSSIARLALSGLVRPGTRNTNRHALREFIEHGVRYAFPGQVGREVLGVPTAHSAPPIVDEIDAIESIVWPAKESPQAVRGLSMTPLYANASVLVERSPHTYAIATLVDVFRVGRVRERAIATRRLNELLYATEPAADV